MPRSSPGESGEHRRRHNGWIARNKAANTDARRTASVTDFIVWHAKWGGRDHEWPAFNIADAALCVGVGLMVLDMFLNRPAPAPSSA